MQRRIREEKPRPRRRRRRDDDVELLPVAAPAPVRRATSARSLLDRLHEESEHIDRMLTA
ncbi:MAG: hypothetical protein ACRDHI_11800 [Actinomycetota bacterium]